MKFLYCAVISTLMLVSSQVTAQGTSNKGTDFWLGYGNHVAGYFANSQKMAVYITSDVSTSGMLSVGGIDFPFTVTANSVTTVAVPQTAYLGGTEGKIVGKGIHITSLKPIVAYAHIYDSSVSGATLVLPTNTLGKEYYSINYSQISNQDNSYSFFFVIAVEDNTQIVITPSVTTLGGLQAGVASSPINLNKGEIYQVFGTKTTSTNPVRGSDLTGSIIRTVSTGNDRCKKVAVFSGSGKVSIGCLSGGAQTAGSADNLFQQVYPTSTWGKKFITAPSKNRNYDIFRVVKSDPTAVVSVNGQIIPAANFVNGLYYDFNSQAVNYIESDKAIQTVQYQVTQGKSIGCTPISGDVGDPEMIYLNPLEQTLNKITMYSTPFFNISKHYINVVIPTNGVASFTVDGVDKSTSFQPVAALPGYSYAQLEVASGTHNLKSDVGFNAIAYGFGNAESYGYAAGASLVSTGLQVFNATASASSASVGCINAPYNLEVSLPYQTTKLSIDYDDGQGEQDIPIELLGTYLKDNITYYRYKVVENKMFAVIKKYSFKLYANKPTTDDCGSIDQLQLEFEVFPNPTSDFIIDKDSQCANGSITLTDTSPATAGSITKRYWDFGDGTTEVRTTGAAFTHTYTTAGDFEIKLIIESSAGCLSPMAAKKSVHISPLPIADFLAVAPLCTTKGVVFKDKSTSAEGVVTNWNWDFGDGEVSTDKDPTHTYSAAGTFKVKLTVTAATGCVASKVIDVKINPLPKPDFELPEICLADGTASFANISSIEDGSEAQITYLWNYGDQFANAQRPNTSVGKNGSHAYTRSGFYQVTLTATSANGCVVVTTKTFTVNGSIPEAKFLVNNQNSLCSDQPVEFQDKATVDFGEVTKIEWFFDFTNKPNTPDLVDETPGSRASPKLYKHSYPKFSTVASKNYTIKMKVYSGGTCVNEVVKQITILAIPTVDFSLPNECLEDGVANFGNLSNFVQGNTNLVYNWDFGDARATTTYPNTSTAKDAQHRYAASGAYTITLTVAAPNTCAVTVSKTFVVKDAIPAPKFQVVNETLLCSNNPISFKDESTIAFGRVAKVEMIYDLENSPNVIVTDNSPANKTYNHKYSEFFAPAEKRIVVRMICYAENGCSKNFDYTITLKSVPEIVFTQPAEICMEVQSVQIEAKEKNQRTGTGLFSGAGVSATGLFKPAKAGVGSHVITYTFTATNGCVVQQSQSITVNETPFVDASMDKTILQGGQYVLPAIATGTGRLTYKWTPAKGLDKDDILNPTASPDDDVTYTLTVVTDKGCIAASSVFIKVLKEPTVPNSFSPNGDGINDVWNIKYLDSYPNPTVEIFNRSGTRVFYSEGYNQPFDGTYRNEPLPVGTYYYIVNPNVAGRKKTVGNVFILR